MNREAIETKLSSGVATPAEAQGLTFRSAAEPTASEGGEERSERSDQIAKMFLLLRDESDVCANLRRSTRTWSAEHVVHVGGRPALMIAPGTVFSVDEEGRWTCSFRYALQPFCTAATWTMKLTFRSRCGTALVTLGDCWSFQSGAGSPQTTEPIWADPYGLRGGIAALRIDANREFFPLMSAAKGHGGESEYRVEVRSDTSPGLRRDFARIDRIWMRVDGLFRMDYPPL